MLRILPLPLFLIMSQLGLIGNRTAVVFVYIIINLPVVIWLMRAFFDEIPRELDEAAAQRVCRRNALRACAASSSSADTQSSLDDSKTLSCRNRSAAATRSCRRYHRFVR